jgi:hypothetical protein
MVVRAAHLQSGITMVLQHFIVILIAQLKSQQLQDLQEMATLMKLIAAMVLVAVQQMNDILLTLMTVAVQLNLQVI